MTEKTSSKRYNNYSLAILLSFLAGIAVTLALLLTAHGALGEMPQWLYELLCAIFGMFSISQIVSGSGYFSTWMDILTNGDVTLIQVAESAIHPNSKTSPFLNFMPKRKMEFVGLILGLIVALALTIALVVKKAASVFVTVFPVVGTIVFFLTNLSAISGLCSRLGRCADYFRKFGSELRGENVNYVISVLAGAVIGVILASVFLGVGGVTSVMTAGGAIPLWFGAAVFFITTVSTAASASGYIGRAFDFLLGKRLLGVSKDSSDLGLLRRASAERIGTVIGITVGVGLGVTLIATGLALTPMFGMGLPLWAAGILVMAASMSAMGGLGNRLGYVIDTLRGYRGDQEHTMDRTNSQDALLDGKFPPEEYNDQPEEYNDPSVLNSWVNDPTLMAVARVAINTVGVAKKIAVTTECKMEIIEPEVKHYEIPVPSFGKSRFSFHKTPVAKIPGNKTVVPKPTVSSLSPRVTAAPAA
jgi:hypothetical protein